MKKEKKDKSLYELKEEVIEDLATAVENDEIRNEDPLEDLEEANGKEQEEVIEDVEELEYADGKERDKVDEIEDQEAIYGMDIISPYGTADMSVFARKIDNLDIAGLQKLAERNGLPQSADLMGQHEILIRGFQDWLSQNGSLQTSASIKAEKGARAVAYEGSNSVKELDEKLKSKTLSDLQSTAAQLGFSPGYDRDRLIELIKQEYRRQS